MAGPIRHTCPPDPPPLGGETDAQFDGSGLAELSNRPTLRTISRVPFGFMHTAPSLEAIV